jgi:hypothetical protein
MKYATVMRDYYDDIPFKPIWRPLGSSDTFYDKLEVKFLRQAKNAPIVAVWVIMIHVEGAKW